MNPGAVQRVMIELYSVPAQVPTQQVMIITVIPTPIPATPQPVRVVTSIPSPMPSPTSMPSSPTPVPPTLTPTPIPPDTLPGTVLDVSDVWKQKNVVLNVDKYEFYHHYQTTNWAGQQDHVLAFIIRFSLENKTGKDIVLNFDKSHFSAQDDAGTKYAFEYMLLGAENKQIEGYNETFRDGQQLLITIAFGNDATVNSRAKNMIVSVTQLSRVVKAKWSIEIPR
jgi:hypothetical protein